MAVSCERPSSQWGFQHSPCHASKFHCASPSLNSLQYVRFSKYPSLSLSSSPLWSICHLYGPSVPRDGVRMWSYVHLCLNLPLFFIYHSISHFPRLWPTSTGKLNFEIAYNSILSRKNKNICHSLRFVCAFHFSSWADSLRCSASSFLFFRKGEKGEKASVYMPITQYRIFEACSCAATAFLIFIPFLSCNLVHLPFRKNRLFTLLEEAAWRKGCFSPSCHMEKRESENNACKYGSAFEETSHCEMAVVVPDYAAYKNKWNCPKLVHCTHVNCDWFWFLVECQAVGCGCSEALMQCLWVLQRRGMSSGWKERGQMSWGKSFLPSQSFQIINTR